MNSGITLQRLASAATPPLALARALADAHALVREGELRVLVLAELGDLELPPATLADAMQLRATASLYLASALESAGLVQAAEDFVALVRSGALPGDLGDAAAAADAFWKARTERITESERLALFGRLFGTPGGPQDLQGGSNSDFDERLLDLCDALMKAVDGGSQGAVRTAGTRLAENIAGAMSDMVVIAARDILDALSQAVAILNHRQVLLVLGVRTLWDAVSAIDRRFRRPPRHTLSHLRRGRAGMAVLAWLADAVDHLERGSGPVVAAGDRVLDAAIEWVDETLSLVRADDAAPAADTALPPARQGRRSAASVWQELGR